MTFDIHKVIPAGPMKVGSWALVVTVLALFWLGWQAMAARQGFEELKNRHVRVDELSGDVARLDEVLTMSARMAVTTGEPQWEARYRKFKPELDKALHEMVVLAPESGVAEVVERIHAANTALVQMEHKALELAGQSHREQALAVLDSEEYNAQKQVYAANMSELDADLQHAINRAVDVEIRRARTAVVVTAIALPLLLVFWLLAVRTFDRWQSELRLNQETLVRQADELAQLNEGLDAKVAEQTQTIELSRQEALSLLDESRQRSAELAQQAQVLRQTTERLRVSEEQFRGSFESSAIGNALVGLDGRWLKVNQALCEIVGYSESELLAMDFQTLTHADDLEADLDHVRRLVAGELSNYQMEKRYLHKDGHVVHALLSVSLVKAVRGAPLHFVSQVQDVTARKRAEEQQVRFFTHTLNPMCICGFDGSTKQANPALESLTGFTHDELLATPFLEFAHSDDRGEVISNVQKLAAGEVVQLFEFRVLCKDGSFKWVDWNAVPFLDSQVFYTIGNDVTDRHEAQAVLDERNDRISTLMNSTAAGIYGIDMKGNCTFANPACLRMLGYSAEDFVGRNIHQLAHHSYPDGTPMSAEVCRILRAFREEIDGHVDDEVLWRQDGTALPVEYWSYPIRRNGQVTGCAVSFIDLTKRKAAQDERDRFFNLVPNLMVVAGFDGYVKRVNLAFNTIGDWADDEVLSEPFLDFFHPNDREKVVAELQQLMVGGVTQAFEVRSRLKDGSYRWFSWSARAFPDWQVIFATAQDVTERKQAEESLR
ncbi:MAG: PAS domain S-box protein, partial [Rhodopirellula sp.]|nr:PAS domain S-box protein [Rhodopirellula sp.]